MPATDSELMNSPGSYLRQLQSALMAGSGCIPEDIRRCAFEFVLQKQHPDGGFCGRSDEPDLYYTAFALHALMLIGLPNESVLAPTIQWLLKASVPVHSLIDLYSYAQALVIVARHGNPEVSVSWYNLQRSLPVFLSNFRTPTGGYVARPTEHRVSVYQTFLALLCYDLADREPPNQSDIATWLVNQQRCDGGFADLNLVPLSATNPTAAALAASHILGCVSGECVSAALNFLQSMYVPHLGFRANQRIPVPDLLSTFTALWTVRFFKSADYIDSRALFESISALQQADGGFCASLAEIAIYSGEDALGEHTDVEYTFYGLASLALLARDLHDAP